MFEKMLKENNTDRIINLMKKFPEKSFDAENIADILKLSSNSVRTYLASLRRSGTIKIVGCLKASILYQLKENKMPELRLKMREEGYDSANSFFKNYNYLFEKGMISTEVRRIIEKNNLPSYPMLYKGGICTCYKTSDLKALFDKSNTTTKKSQKSSEKATKLKITEEDIPLTRRVELLLIQNITEKFCSKDIAEILDVSERSAIYTLKGPKSKGLVKFVDWEPAYKKGVCLSFIQLKKSPLPALKVYKKSARYATVSDFLKKYNISRQEFSEKTAHLEPIPISVRGILYRGYAVSDISALFKQEPKRTSKKSKKTTKKTKRTYNKKKISVEVTSHKENMSLFAKILNFFKKKTTKINNKEFIEF